MPTEAHRSGRRDGDDVLIDESDASQQRCDARLHAVVAAAERVQVRYQLRDSSRPDCSHQGGDTAHTSDGALGIVVELTGPQAQIYRDLTLHYPPATQREQDMHQ